MTQGISIRRSLAGVATAAAVLVSAGPAAAADSYPCGRQEHVSWATEVVQLCPLTSPMSNGNVPVYRAPVSHGPPAGWLHGTANQRFVCERRFDDAPYVHPRGWRNVWWAYTKSDDGIWGWTPEVFFRGGLDDEPDAGLRPCNGAPQPQQPLGPLPGGPPEAQPAPTPVRSTPGGLINRAEVLERSQAWIARRVMYSQTHSEDGYRRDCSGFVSMAWHLWIAPTSSTLRSSHYTVPIAKSDLQPGDMLGKPGHVALFVRWARPGRPVVREEYLDGQPATERTWSSSWAAQYTARRYRNIR